MILLEVLLMTVGLIKILDMICMATDGKTLSEMLADDEDGD